MPDSRISSPKPRRRTRGEETSRGGQEPYGGSQGAENWRGWGSVVTDISSVRHQRRRYRPGDMLPIEPLERLFAEYWILAGVGSHGIAQLLSWRFGGDADSHHRRWLRSKRQRTVHYLDADEWCVVLGTHPSVVYGTAWSAVGE